MRMEIGSIVRTGLFAVLILIKGTLCLSVLFSAIGSLRKIPIFNSLIIFLRTFKSQILGLDGKSEMKTTSRKKIRWIFSPLLQSHLSYSVSFSTKPLAGLYQHRLTACKLECDLAFYYNWSL